jgi:methylated-DNA-[protein]-cysteine S-methyltransferase
MTEISGKIFSEEVYAMTRKTSFSEKIYAMTKKIPWGKVSTYKQVAILAGKPNAYRAVGNVLNKNSDKSVPCYRVVRADGSVGNFNRGANEKIKTLKSEGIEIENKKIELKKYLHKF